MLCDGLIPLQLSTDHFLCWHVFLIWHQHHTSAACSSHGYYPHPTPSFWSGVPQHIPNPILTFKEITPHIVGMHKLAPFALNPKSLITESAGLYMNGTFTSTGHCWLINPLIAFSVLTQDTALQFFPALPTIPQLKNCGYQPINFKSVTKAIRELIQTKACNIQLLEIERLPHFNFLSFTHGLQHQVMQALQALHPALASSMHTFMQTKFNSEHEISEHRAHIASSMTMSTTQPPAEVPHNPRRILASKEISKCIAEMHKSSPFIMNPKSLITERAGHDVNGTYTPTGNSWLINPLITFSVLSRAAALQFFPPLPTLALLKKSKYAPMK